jgi:hypothetical protein
MVRNRLWRLGLLVLLLASPVILWAGGGGEAAKPVQLYVIAENPENQAAESELWGVFAKANPGVTVKCESFEDTGYEAFAAKVNAGDAPMIVARDYPEMITNWKLYVNLLDIKYPYWDIYKVDMRKLFPDQAGIKDYVPGLQGWGSFSSTFLYHEDLFEKAGVTRADVLKLRTWADLDALLAKLKVYVDAHPSEVKYTFDWAWSGWVEGKITLAMWGVSMGASVKDIQNMYLGKFKWTDLTRNPFVRPLEKVKEWYGKGYFPKEFWNRLWEEDYEASFIAKNGMLTWHGPWLWSKAAAASPNSRVSGFPVPVSNGIIATYPVNPGGGGIFKQWQDKPEFDTIKKAFIWYNSPDIIKLRSDYYGYWPLNVKDEYVKGFESKFPQYQKVLKESAAGAWGKVTWVTDAWAEVADRFKATDKPPVIDDDMENPLLGDYFSGKITMDDLMKHFQEKWVAAYAKGLGM